MEPCCIVVAFLAASAAPPGEHHRNSYRGLDAVALQPTMEVRIQKRMTIAKEMFMLTHVDTTDHIFKFIFDVTSVSSPQLVTRKWGVRFGVVTPTIARSDGHGAMSCFGGWSFWMKPQAETRPVSCQYGILTV